MKIKHNESILIAFLLSAFIVFNWGDLKGQSIKLAKVPSAHLTMGQFV